MKGHAYQARPCSAATAVGIAVPTAMASKATRVTSRTQPGRRQPVRGVERAAAARSPSPPSPVAVHGRAERTEPARTVPVGTVRAGRDVRGADYLRAVICSVAAGTTVFRSPTTPKSASSKIGASGSLLTATIVFEVCMPARCWMAPEMPTAM